MKVKGNEKENIIIGFTVIYFFLLFLVCWVTDGGAWVYGMYSEVDGQLAAWISKAIINWGKPSDMGMLNPFQGMGSTFMPLNSWWNPGALALSLPMSKLFNFTFSYSIYWLEIFSAIIILSLVIGLTKYQSIIVAEVFVLFFFPPFSAYFNTIPYFSLAPMYSHWLAIFCIITVCYNKLGSGGLIQNLILGSIIIFGFFVVAMTAGFYLVAFIPVYALIIAGLALDNINRRNLKWKISLTILILSLFWILHAYTYYSDTLKYVSASVSVETKQAISFSIPKSLHKHTSIFYGEPPMYFFMHVFALLGGIGGVFYRNGKYKWFSISFIVIALIPDIVSFLFENKIVSGSISQLSVIYYLWVAYPFYCIFFILAISNLIYYISRVLHFSFINILNNTYIEINEPNKILINTFFNRFGGILSLIVVPTLATCIWYTNLSRTSVDLKEVGKPPIVEYLENKIGIKPGTPFRGLSAAYFASKGASLNYLYGIDQTSNHFTMDNYIQSREFLNRRFENRHMLADLWNFNIPTLEEYGQQISLPMYVFFNKMLSQNGDTMDRHFLNIYKLNLKVLQALGVRFLISDKVLHDKDAFLAYVENQTYQTSRDETGYIDYSISVEAEKIYQELMVKYNSSSISSSSFMAELKDKLDIAYPGMTKDKEKIFKYLNMSVTSALGSEHDRKLWSYSDLKKIKYYFDIAIFTWMASPPIYLYELMNPNLATYSPTQLIQSNNIDDLFLHMTKPDFSFEKSVVIQMALNKNIASQLKKANDAEMHYDKNSVRVKANSSGWSILLLPLQYSHCFNLIDELSSHYTTESPRFIRANLVQAAILFKKRLNVELNFEFGVGRNAYCRRKDIVDMQVLEKTKI